MSKSFYKTLNNKTLKIDTLEKIANVLNVDIDSFFYEANNFITDGTDLKLLIGLYKELLTEILEENPALVNRERRIKQFETYNKLVDLNKYNWVKFILIYDLQ